MFQFRSFIKSIQTHLMERIPSVEELKNYFGRCYRDLKPQISCETINDTIEEKFTIINVIKIEKIAEKYKCKKAFDQIPDYDHAVMEFCDEIWLNIYCCLSLSCRHASRPRHVKRLILFCNGN